MPLAAAGNLMSFPRRRSYLSPLHLFCFSVVLLLSLTQLKRDYLLNVSDGTVHTMSLLPVLIGGCLTCLLLPFIPVASPLLQTSPLILCLVSDIKEVLPQDDEILMYNNNCHLPLGMIQLNQRLACYGNHISLLRADLPSRVLQAKGIVL